jgi:hypothetical protein
MPIEETVKTYNYYIAEAIKLKIAFIVLFRYSAVIDSLARGTPHDVIETYSPLFVGGTTKLFANSGYTPDEAAKEMSNPKSKVEGVFFGRSYLAHPGMFPIAGINFEQWS